jgi:anti-anti-sigma regulatory factor
MAVVLPITPQVLKIRRSEDSGPAVFALSGRIEETRVPELQKLIEAEAEVAAVTLDLQEVRLVDREAVRFLAACEARGVKLRNCPPYIREWIVTGSDTNHEL